MAKALLSTVQENILRELQENPGYRLYYTSITTYMERPGLPRLSQQPLSVRKLVTLGLVELAGDSYYVISEAGKRYINGVMEVA